MPPLTPGPGPGRRGAAGAAWLAAGLVAAALAGGCAAPVQAVQDPPRVEQLRLRITKVRHAIRETREALSRSRGAAWQAELYVRLAELLGEEARYHYEVAWEREGRRGDALHVPQVRFLKEQAVGVYRKALAEHPATPLAPRILFNIGHELRELGRYDEMIPVLERLAAEHPASPLAAEALLVLGDYWFDKAELDRAEREYLRITEGPPAAARAAEGAPAPRAWRVTGLAHYKLGWVWMNRAECPQALAAFERALAAEAAWQAAPGEGEAAAEQALDVRREALVDLVYCYATERPADGAVAWLREHAHDRGAYLAAMDRLARRYAVIGQAAGALDATRELLRLAPADPERLDDARALYGALKQTGRWEEVGEDVALLTRALRGQASRAELPSDERQALVTEFELYARDLATRAQQAWLDRGAGGGDAEARARLGAAVAAGYEAWLEAFPEAAARRDMLENLADTLAALGRHEEAGLRYVEAAEAAADAAARRQGLYDAVVQLQRSLERLTERSHVERVVVRAALRRAGAELLAAGLPPDQARVVKLAIGRTWYDEGRYPVAIERLTALAWEAPGTEEGAAAVHLVLDAYNTLNDYEGLIAAGYRFLAPDGPASAALRAEITPIVKAAESRRLDEVSLAAAGAEGADLASLETFARRFQGSPLGERALLNAFVAARAAGDAARMYALGEELAATYPRSEQVPGILASLGKQAVATLDLDRALALFQRAGQVDPARRAPLLVASGEVLESAGDAEGAVRAYQEAARAAPEGAVHGLALERLAGALERVGDPSRTASILGEHRDDAPPEALAVLGLAELQLGRVDAGEATLQRVLGDAGGDRPEAVARAHYGMAEAITAALARYPAGDDLDVIQELVTLVEVAEQSWLNAARQGSPMVTPAALGRLAAFARAAARQLEALPTPAGLAPADAATFRKGLAGRVAQLGATAAEALGACAGQAWTSRVFLPPVRTCLRGEAPARDAIAFDRLRPRRAAALGPEAEALRARLAKNPDDGEALQALGTLALDAGDAHVARLAFDRAAQAGGGPEALNLLGLAAWGAGDAAGALEAFARAADGGLEAGRQNLAAGLRQLGLGAAADEALSRWPAGQGGGRRLEGGP